VERKVLGMSVRSWIAVSVFLAALLVVVGYVLQLRGKMGPTLTYLGLVWGVLAIGIGAFPAEVRQR